jgi:hypothetical protein
MSEAAVAAMPAPDTEPVKRSLRLARIVMVALALNVALDIVAIVSDRSYHSLAQQILSGQAVSLQKADAADHRVHMIALASIALYLVTAVLFVVWFRRAYQNVSRMGVYGQRWSSGWAVGAWFVPFLNLVRPKQIANDTWRGSDPNLPMSSGLSLVDPPVVFSVWWGLWILGFIVGRVSFSKLQGAETAAALSSASNWLTVADATDALAAGAALIVVHLLSARQSERAQKLTSHSPA